MGGPILGGYAGIDFDLLPLAFVVVIIGGMGSLKGALVGSIVVGMIDNFGKALVPELSYFTLFAPMVIVLALKPTGLVWPRVTPLAACAAGGCSRRRRARLVLAAGRCFSLVLGGPAHRDRHPGDAGDEPRHPARIHRASVARPRGALRRRGLCRGSALDDVSDADSGRCVLGGIVVGVLLSAAIGLIVSHVRDVYFLMITLAIGMVLWGLSYRWIPVTGGDNGSARHSAARGARRPAVCGTDRVLLRRAGGVCVSALADGDCSCGRRSG